MKIRKLSAMPYAQAHVEISGDGDIYLFSYTSMVAGITSNGFCFCDGLHSQTTRRHIGTFAKEYAAPFSYRDFRLMFEENIMINNETGEILDR